jgi:hydroxypyruvate reductase
VFDRTDALASSPARETALACLRAGIAAARPDRAVADAVSLAGDTLRVGGATHDLAAVDRLVLVGAGKPAAGIATALESVLGDRLDGGCVVVPPADADPDASPVARLAGDHPSPSERGAAATRHLRETVAAADARALVLVAVGGGGSALLVAPADGIALADLRATTDALLAAGADVGEINAVRKHLSALKGGGLARLAAPARLVGLVLSDVTGDDPATVASGPTVPDPTTHADALAVLDRYAVDAPPAVRDRLERGVRGDAPETPGPDDPAFDRASTHVLAGGRTALDAAARAARERGYRSCLLSSRIRGEAREAARSHAAVAEEAAATGDPVAPPAVVLAGGECTVALGSDAEPGTGGPNAEFALSAALDLAGAGPGDRVALAAVDTDGRDGASEVAGGLVDGTTLADAPARERARSALAAHDAAGALNDLGATLRTGPTGTNVNDLRVAVIEADGDGDRSGKET